MNAPAVCNYHELLGDLPNLRKMFRPDPGYYIVDSDLDRADLQVVVWEAGDDKLKEALKKGMNVHLLNSGDLGLTDITWNQVERAASDPEYAEHLEKLAKRVPKGRLYSNYYSAKRFVHAANYGVTAKTLASTLQITVREAQTVLNRWFSEHPALAEWHDRVWEKLCDTRQVLNPFGYRRYYFGRIDNSTFKEALAWVPQSTVAIVTRDGHKEIYRRLSFDQIQVLFQNHDSLVYQVHISKFPRILHTVKECMEVTIPYDDPLTIPVGFQVSAKSWGDVKTYNLNMEAA